MLEANPLLNSVQVKEILQNTARSDNFTGTTPNTKWGYGKVDAFAAVSEVFNATSVQEVKNELPNEFVLNQNYPNPFNPTTSIKFNLPTESKVRLNVFNVLGEEVAELVNNNLQAGFHSVQFDARSLNSGIYFYKIEAGDPSAGSGHGFVQIRKMMLLK
ncbi:MAG: T9SS type A sorting domain-containing protein [Ignavibacteriae bacterium]|nr:T9SS type A sorting domain-containing protein [Ignavibacteriota bacterium]